MTVAQKLQTIQKLLHLTQTQLAERIGVSFVTLNRWKLDKVVPRASMLAKIEDLYLEVTGQKVIPLERLVAKKKALSRRASHHRNVVKEIVSHPDLRDQFVLTLTYNTNRMEGSTLSELDTAAILFENLALPNKSLTEHLEAKNHQAALLYIFEHILTRQEISEDFVLKLHSILMNGIWPDAGLYRRHGVRIVGVNLPTANFLKIPDLIPVVMEEATMKTKDAIHQCTTTHARLEQIHPFSDGNGRVGRLLMTAMLLKANMPPAIIKQEQRQLYNTYLFKAQTRDDASQLEDFICDAIEEGYNVLERK